MALTDLIKKLISDIAVKENIVDCKLEADAGSKHGDNFLGVMIAVKLVGFKEINGEKQSVTKHLLCKIPPTCAKRRSVYQTTFAFECEVEIYSKLLPMFSQFQKEKGLTVDESFASFPKAYVALSDTKNDHHILIMDDLRFKNFKMFPKERRTDIEHATLVMTEMAKFHAVSLALKDQRPQSLDEFKAYDMISRGMKFGKCARFFEESLSRCYRAVKNVKYKESIADLQENFAEVLEKCASEEYIGDTGIIIHGDSWNNNLMFSYKDNESYKNPLAMTFVDWQFCRYAPPALDIFYFIFSATDKSFRAEHYRSLLNVYHSTLSTNIKKMGSDPEKLYSFDKLENDLKKYGKYGLIVSSLLLELCIADENQVNDANEYCDRLYRNEECNLFTNFDDNTTYQILVNDVVEDFFEYGYFN